MAPREELIASAVSFLQDPSVAAAPLEKRRAFLESKNLTAEEIDLSLARVGTTPPASTGQVPAAYPSYPPSYPQQTPYGYAPQYGGGPWAQQAMEPPRRDWRDWFIMATVTTGVGWGLYEIGKRYVMPLIKPPTPEQIEQDKADIAGQFDRAFTLIEQLSTDTNELKLAEKERNEKLDKAIEDVETVIADLKSANERREQDTKTIAEDVNRVRDMIPKALEGWKNDRDAKISDLGGELKSLKTLLNNRLQQPARIPTPPATSGISTPTYTSSIGHTNGNVVAGVPGVSVPGSDGVKVPTAPTTPLPSSVATTENGSGIPSAVGQGVPSAVKKPNRATIPAWQMAGAQQSSTSENTSAQP